MKDVITWQVVYIHPKAIISSLEICTVINNVTVLRDGQKLTSINKAVITGIDGGYSRTQGLPKRQR
jgi:hypothetical protein